MGESKQVQSLLEEIRDLQKEHLAEYRAQAARSVELAEQAAARQASIGTFYRRVVFVVGIVAAVLLVVLWQMLT